MNVTDDGYTVYAIEYFDSDSVSSQWATVYGYTIKQAVEAFKRDHPVSRVYDVYIRHNDSDDFFEEEDA